MWSLNSEKHLQSRWKGKEVNLKPWSKQSWPRLKTSGKFSRGICWPLRRIKICKRTRRSSKSCARRWRKNGKSTKKRTRTTRSWSKSIRNRLRSSRVNWPVYLRCSPPTPVMPITPSQGMKMQKNHRPRIVNPTLPPIPSPRSPKVSRRFFQTITIWRKRPIWTNTSTMSRNQNKQ